MRALINVGFMHYSGLGTGGKSCQMAVKVFKIV